MSICLSKKKQVPFMLSGNVFTSALFLLLRGDYFQTDSQRGHVNNIGTLYIDTRRGLRLRRPLRIVYHVLRLLCLVSVLSYV